MGNRKTTFLLVCALVLSMLAACGGGVEPAASTQGQVETSAGAEGTGGGSGDSTAETTTVKATVNEAAAAVEPAAAVAAAPSEDHDAAEDHIWDSAAATQITLNDDTITVEGDGATVDGSKVTITSAGAYNLSGSLADGQIVVDTGDEGIVRLVLNGVEISSSTSTPIYVVRAEETIIVLAEGAENTVSDGDAYVLEDAAGDEPNAAIFSKGDLTIDGSGSLIVDGNYNDGIASKDGLVITGGAITVSAADDGIRGKDYLIVKDGNITVDAQGDGLKADNEEDAAKGYVAVEGGVLNITSGGDAITAQTNVTISGGEITLSSGGGSQSYADESTSAKGIKGVASVTIEGGTFAIDSADDAIHSNGSVTIQGGAFVIATGDDAVHADATLEINGGDLRVTESYEGIESAVITINGGKIHIVASDDALNVAGGNDGSGMNQRPGQAGGLGRRPGQDGFASSSNYHLYINGGYIVVEAGGDGIDVNGAIDMTDGVVIVNGPTQQMNGALDYDVSFKITGGFLVAAGSSGMAQAPDTSSTQYSVLLNLSAAVQAGTLVHVQTSKGAEILTFSPSKDYQSIVISSPELANNTTYDVYFGGASTGEATDGLYQGGAYASGSKAGSFTTSGIVTMLGQRAR